MITVVDNSEALVELTDSTAKILRDEMAFIISSDAPISRRFALALYDEFKTFTKEAGACDHSVNICICSALFAVYILGVTLGLEKKECSQCQRPLPNATQPTNPQAIEFCDKRCADGWANSEDPNP